MVCKTLGEKVLNTSDIKKVCDLNSSKYINKKNETCGTQWLATKICQFSRLDPPPKRYLDPVLRGPARISTRAFCNTICCFMAIARQRAALHQNHWLCAQWLMRTYALVWNFESNVQRCQQSKRCNMQTVALKCIKWATLGCPASPLWIRPLQAFSLTSLRREAQVRRSASLPTHWHILHLPLFRPVYEWQSMDPSVALASVSIQAAIFAKAWKLEKELLNPPHLDHFESRNLMACSSGVDGGQLINGCQLRLDVAVPSPQSAWSSFDVLKSISGFGNMLWKIYCLG